MEHHIQTNTSNIIYKQIHGTSYRNIYIESHVHTRNIIYKQMYGTSYTNKYMEHLIQKNTWNFLNKQMHEHLKQTNT